MYNTEAKAVKMPTHLEMAEKLLSEITCNLTPKEQQEFFFRLKEGLIYWRENRIAEREKEQAYQKEITQDEYNMLNELKGNPHQVSVDKTYCR